MRHRGRDRSAQAGRHRVIRCLAGSPGLTLRKLDIGAENAALAGVIASFLGPVEFASARVHRDADAPFPRIRARARIAVARVHEGFDMRAVEVCAHHAHAFRSDQ